MTRKWPCFAAPIIAAAALVALPDTICYAGGVPTGARTSSGGGYGSASPAYFSGFGNYFVSPVPSASYLTPVAPSRSAQAGTEEQEESVNSSAPAKLEVLVPATAELWFDGDKTGQGGSLRNFISPELQPGKSFTYTIRAHWTSPTGQVVDETRQVKVQAGKRLSISSTRNIQLPAGASGP